MKLEKQICSLEHAKKLKELGVKQESEWIWAIMNIGAGQSAYIYNTVGDKGYHRDEHYSAYTVAELGDILKDYSGNVEYDGKFKKWRIIYFESSYTTEIIGSEADARAKLLIYLLENKLLKAKT